MRIRTALVFVLGIVVLAGGALFFWPDLDDEPPASAQEVVESACSGIDDVDFDFSAVMKGTYDENNSGVTSWPDVTIKARVSGKDFEYEYIVPDGSSEGHIRLGDTAYMRLRNSDDWYVSEKFHASSIGEILPMLGDAPICPDLSQVVRKGEDEVNGVKVTQYTSGDYDGTEKAAVDALDETFYGLKTAVAHTYWVGIDGQLVQYRNETRAFANDEDGSQRTYIVSLFTFLDIGEPNTITAPTLGE